MKRNECARQLTVRENIDFEIEITNHIPFEIYQNALTHQGVIISENDPPISSIYDNLSIVQFYDAEWTDKVNHNMNYVSNNFYRGYFSK